MRDERPRVGVAVLVVDEIDGEPRYLLGRRGSGGNTGMWVIPGGGVELGEHWRDAGVRELKEETGLDVGIGRIADDYRFGDVVDTRRPDTVMEIISRDKKSHRICLVAYGYQIGGVLVPSPELPLLRWFSKQDLAYLADRGEISPPVLKALYSLAVLLPPVRSAVA